MIAKQHQQRLSKQVTRCNHSKFEPRESSTIHGVSRHLKSLHCCAATVIPDLFMSCYLPSASKTLKGSGGIPPRSLHAIASARSSPVGAASVHCMVWYHARRGPGVSSRHELVQSNSRTQYGLTGPAIQQQQHAKVEPSSFQTSNTCDDMFLDIFVDSRVAAFHATIGMMRRGRGTSYHLSRYRP